MTGKIHSFIHQHLKTDGPEQFDFLPHPSVKMIVITQNSIHAVFTFYVLQRFIAFFPQQVVQAVVNLISAKKNHVCFLTVNTFRQLFRILPAK